MSPVIERYAVGKTCEWCANLAGIYQYPDEVPKEVYQRHANCNCIVIYKLDKHAKDFQDVWSKQWNDQDTERRIEYIREKSQSVQRNPEENILQIKLNTIFNGKDKLPSYSSLGIEIPEEVSGYLKKLESVDYIEGEKCSFPISILPIMSREEDVEFAVVSIQEKSYLVKGNKDGTTIPDELAKLLISNKGTIDYHSHPFTNDLIPSLRDCESLKRLPWQNESYLITENGKVTIFNQYGIIETGLNSTAVDNRNRSEIELMYEDLFGGD